MTPERLGPYRILGTLGRGGMGAVYRAVNDQTDEVAAVKILSGPLATDPDFRRRFEAEIETLRKLRHPNIVRLFGFGEDEGRLFFAMELVQGNTLQQELQEGRQFDWREVVDIGQDMCRALRHAHDRGIIHRDIKPANILVGPDEQVKLSDFGIARLYGYSRLTSAGNVLGTLDYMAPEQADAQPVGPRSDLYSLGGVLYTLLARRPPFRAKSLVEMLEMQRTAIAEPVRRYARDVPVELEAIVARLLEKDPDKRFATATVLSRRLEALTARLSAPAPAWQPDGEHFDQNPTLARPKPLTPASADETRDATVPAVPPRASAVPDDAGELPETKETLALLGGGARADADVADAKQTSSAGATRKSGSHFVRVEEKDLDRFESEESEKGPLISLQTWVLIGALVLLTGTIWYFLQPPSVDGLYERIHATTADGTLGSYRQAKDDIDRFLELYPDDLRSGQLREYRDEIDLANLENKLERQAEGLIDAGTALPIQRDWFEAHRYANLDPERGMAKFQALIDLYDSHGDDTGPTADVVELAERQLEKLREQVDEDAVDRLALVLHRLDQADEVEATEPDRANRIREAVIELYGGKPWADDAVRRAREALQSQGR